MIKIENTALFGCELFVNNDHVLLNITVDPSVVELKSYRRTPFASIIIKSSEIANYVSDNDVKLDYFTDVLENSSLRLYNSYVDSEYDSLKSTFPDVNFHTVILYVDADAPVNDYDKIILICAHPVQGFVSPINKSNEYALLNGSFLSTKLFSMKNIVLDRNPRMALVYTDNDFLYYDKLVYVYVDIKTKFEIHEYLRISESHGSARDYIYEYGIDDGNLKMYSYMKERKIPVSGREYLFQKPDKNMFHLSDIPSDIMMQKHSISKKI